MAPMRQTAGPDMWCVKASGEKACSMKGPVSGLLSGVAIARRKGGSWLTELINLAAEVSQQFMCLTHFPIELYQRRLEKSIQVLNIENASFS